MTETTRNLPPDPDGMNDNRALWAEDALAAFMASTGTDEDDAVADLLADLMHYCDFNGLDFEAELARAERNYQGETWEDAS